MLAYQRLAVASRYRLPAVSKTHTPSPRSTSSSSRLTAPMSANGCQNRLVAVLTAMASTVSPGAPRMRTSPRPPMLHLGDQRAPELGAYAGDGLAGGGGRRQPAEEPVDRPRPPLELARHARFAQRGRVRLALVAQHVDLGREHVRRGDARE